MYLYKLRKKILHSIFILGFSQFILHAQQNDIRFRHLSIEEGLSQSYALCIIQDHNGFVWIGTETGGLNRYDGYQFTVYLSGNDNPNSLSNGWVLSLLESSDSMIWVATEKGLNRFDPAREQFTRFFCNPGDSTSISNNMVAALCQDNNGDIWIGTARGLNRYSPAKNRFKRYIAEPDNPRGLSNDDIRALRKSKSGVLWIGTYGGGLYALDTARKQFTCYKNILDDSSSLSSNNILSICEDTTGVLWIGTDGGGLNRFDPRQGTFIRYKNSINNHNSLSDDHINVVFEDKAGALWVGTDKNGLNLFNRKTDTFIHYQNDPDDPASLSNNRIISIFEDDKGGLWFGTRGGGVNLYIKEARKFIHYKPDPGKPGRLSYKMIWKIYEDSHGMIWIGTDGGGLNKLDRARNTFSYYKNNPQNPRSISDNSIYDICEDKDGMLWIGTRSGGLNKYDRLKDSFFKYRCAPNDPTTLSNDWVTSICEDRNGALWIGTNGGGLCMFDRKKEKFIRYSNNPRDSTSLACNKIRCILESRTGVLWIGTLGGGLNKYDPEENRFICYKYNQNNAHSLSSDFISALFEDHTGTLWLGIENGLNRFDNEKQTFTRFTIQDGLPDNVIYDILEDDHGKLWMSTNKGISRFNPLTREFTNYDEKDGLQSNEFNAGAACKSRSGEMFFGGINGFNVFHPDSITRNLHIPPIIITSFRLFNKPVPIGPMADGRVLLKRSITETHALTLAHTDNVFSFEFTALNYLLPEKNSYAYMMEGLDKEWNYTGSSRRFASYTGLQPGSYVFRVKGSNNDGVWNEKGVSIKVTIIPPFWKTWWFYALLYLIIITLAALAYVVQINRLQKKKEEEEQRKALTDVNQVVEQVTAAVYRRKLNSNEYEFMGEGITKITGYSPREITLDAWNRIILKKEMGGDLSHLSLKEVFDRVRKGTLDRWVADYKIATKSGEIRWVRDMITVLRGKPGHSDTILGIMFDITDRKQAEQQLAMTSEELKEKNKVMEEDLNMAREIQTSFLSKYLSCFPPETSRENCWVEFNHVYLPALKLAGDFFDVIPVSDHEVGVLICDVIGHGARASLLAFYLRGLIAELMPVAHDPGNFMSKLNIGLNAIAVQFSTSVFATAFYLVADIKSGELRYTTAGHPMPFILRRSQGIVEQLPSSDVTSGSAIGLHKEYTFATFTASIASGDTVFFFTDGVYEVWNAEDQMFGMERLRDSLQNNLSITDNELLDKVINEILQFTTSNALNDDICLVGMHVGKRK